MRKRIILIVCLCFSALTPAEKMYAAEFFPVSAKQVRTVMSQAKNQLRKWQNQLVRKTEKDAEKKAARKRNRVEISRGSMKIRGPGFRYIHTGGALYPGIRVVVPGHHPAEPEYDPFPDPEPFPEPEIDFGME